MSDRHPDDRPGPKMPDPPRRLPRAAPVLPLTPVRNDWPALARAYADMAAMHMQNYPLLIAELNGIHLDLAVIKNAISPGGEVEQRAKAASHHEIEQATGRLAHATHDLADALEEVTGNEHRPLTEEDVERRLELERTRRERDSWKAKAVAADKALETQHDSADRRVDRRVILWAAVAGSLAMFLLTVFARFVEAAIRGHW